MDESRHFANFGRPEWTRYRDELARRGIVLPPGDAGSMSRGGIQVHYTFRERDRTLSFTLTQLPFWVSSALVWRAIEASVNDIEALR